MSTVKHVAPSLSQTLLKLRGNSQSTIYNALVLIRTRFIKEKDGLRRLRHYDGVKILLELANRCCNTIVDNQDRSMTMSINNANQSAAVNELVKEVSGESETADKNSNKYSDKAESWKKTLDITLSILGNCCMDQKIRIEVNHLDGIKTLGLILHKVNVVSIQNRCVRTLANLALDPSLCDTIHAPKDVCAMDIGKDEVKDDVEDEEEEGDASIIAMVVKLISVDGDADSNQSFLRALRVFADSPDHRQNVLKADGLKASAEILKCEDNTQILAAFKTVFLLCEGYSIEVIRQLVSADTPASLMKLVDHEQKDISNQSVSLLLKLANHEDARPAVGNAGGIPFFIKKATELEPSKPSFSFINALCLCCQEAVNRVRVREHSGLHLMVSLLNNEKYAVMHDRLISAFVCFLYDDPSMDLLMELGIIRSLLHHLKRCVKLSVVKINMFSDKNQINDAGDDLDIGKHNVTKHNCGSLVSNEKVGSCEKETTISVKTTNLQESVVTLQKEDKMDDSDRDAEKSTSVYTAGTLCPETNSCEKIHNSSGKKDDYKAESIVEENAKILPENSPGILDISSKSVKAGNSSTSSDCGKAEIPNKDSMISQDYASIKITSGNFNISKDCLKIEIPCENLAGDENCCSGTVGSDEVLQTACCLVSNENEASITQEMHTNNTDRKFTGHQKEIVTSAVENAVEFIDLSSGSRDTKTNAQSESDVITSNVENLADVSVGKIDSINTEEGTSTSRQSVYSIHSPTYQAACDDWKFDEYFKGSKCKESFSPPSLPVNRSCVSPVSTNRSCVSPVMVYSPMSTTSYGSPEWSPDYSRLSPLDFPELHSGQSWASSPGRWSTDSLGGTSPPYSGRTPGSPVPAATWWCPQELTEDEHHYSSEEDEATDSVIMSEGKAVSVSADPDGMKFILQANVDVGEDCLPFIDISEVKDPFEIDSSSSEISSTSHVSTDPNKTATLKSLSNICPSKNVANSKHERQKLLTVRRKDISKTADLLKDVLKENNDSTGVPSNEQKQTRKPTEPGSVTACNILIILSRFSHQVTPSSVLVSAECFLVLISYLIQVKEPSPRCFRILARLTRNPHCLERLLLEMIPSLIYDYLVTNPSHDKMKSVSTMLYANPSQVKKKLFLKDGSQDVSLETSIEDRKGKASKELIGSFSEPVMQEELIGSCTSQCNIKKENQNDVEDQKEAVDDPACSMTNESRQDKSSELKREISERKRDKLIEHGNSLLSNMYVQAESRFGVGVMSHVMLSGTEQQKKNCVVGLPFICRSRGMRQRFFRERKCLDYLLGQLMNVDQDTVISGVEEDAEYSCLYQYAVQAVHYLSRTLNIQVFGKHNNASSAGQYSSGKSEDRTSTADQTEELPPPAKRLKLRATEDKDVDCVTFIMQDGRRITAKRDLLCQRSQVFCAMLQGHFSETKMADISLPGQNSDAFQLVVKFLEEGEEDVPRNLSLEMSLHILSISDQFMLAHLQNVISNRVIKEHASAVTVATIFQHAVTHSCTQLQAGIIRWVLISQMTTEQRVRCFQRLLSSAVADHARETIHDLILDEL